MNVLSLFDGISAGQLALERAGIKVDNYFASEINEYAIKVTQSHYPNTIQLGDVTKWSEWSLPKIDLIIAGSPCQGFSQTGNKLNFEHPESKLFFEFLYILWVLKSKNPDILFLLENVKMKKEWEQIITHYLEVSPILIDSSLVSAQARERLYWTNIPNVTQPEDKGLVMKDILEEVTWPSKEFRYFSVAYLYPEDSRPITKGRILMGETKLGGFKSNVRFYSPEGKSPTILCRESSIYVDDSRSRCMTAVEHERLQTFPDNYTACIPKSRRYEAIGNSWTVDVIAHVFSGILTKL